MATVLHAAVESGDLEEVRRLLNGDGATLVNAQYPKTRERPLHLAAQLGNVDIVRALLDAGADAHATCTPIYFEKFISYWYRDVTALDIAAAFGHVSVIEVLLATIGPQTVYINPEFCSLDFSAIYGHLEALEMLLAKHPSLPPLIKGRALGFALAYGQVECVRYLLAYGVDPNELIDLYGIQNSQHSVFLAMKEYEDGTGKTILKTDELVLELVKMLVDAGADVHGVTFVPDTNYRWDINWDAMSILFCAAFYGRWQVASYLLSKGADINAKNSQGWSLFHFAVASGSPKTVDVFLKAGAADQVHWKVSMPRDGASEVWTALDLVGMYDERLRQSSSDSLVEDYAKIIKLLVDHGADLHNKNEFGNTPTHSACLISDVRAPAAVVYFANEEDDDTDIEDTSTYHMSTRRLLVIISALLHSGADPNAVNKQKETPLHILLADAMGAVESVLFNYDYQSQCDWNVEKEKLAVKLLFASLCNAVRALVEAGADVNQ